MPNAKDICAYLHPLQSQVGNRSVKTSLPDEINNGVHELSKREKQIVCGLFLSKYDRDALSFLGFGTFLEAFNVLAYGLGARPASIKNYRDELDPFFPNSRQGWHKRALREHCKRVMETLGELDLQTLGGIVEDFFLPQLRLETDSDTKAVLRKHQPGPDSPFAKRLATGGAAERYFVQHFRDMRQFVDVSVVDTTRWGCGFDFRLNPHDSDEYLAVEVKGLAARSGQIQMTALEYEMAEVLSSRYFLVVVRNFEETPFHTIYQSPVHGELSFSKAEREEIRISWSASVA